jgi:hypothetical protein
MGFYILPKVDDKEESSVSKAKIRVKSERVYIKGAQRASSWTRGLKA